jgi:glycine/D-amino acid oxidase-like deaminating enzyme
VRVCVAGGGLTGSLLAWRLAQLPDVRVDLVLGRDSGSDATSASGGAVRAYESLAAQRELAIASMAELLGSPVLQRWAGYQQATSVYIRDAVDDLPAQLAEIQRELHGSAQAMPAAEAFGSTVRAPYWAGPPGVAVVERQAGYVSPSRLRDALIADLAGRPRARLQPGELDEVTTTEAGQVRSQAGGTASTYDVVVLAVGAWTSAFLRAIGVPADGYRTRSIQFTSYDAGCWQPPMFVDDRSGLYGRPLAGRGVLLGVPTIEWDTAPGSAAVTPAVHDRAMQLAATYLPQLRLEQVRARTSAVDCFCHPPVLSLRPVIDSSISLLTFTGGSGACVKTALAASQRAALQIQAGTITGP